MLVTFFLLVPAALLGLAFGVLVRRHPGIDPASARPAAAVAHRAQGTWRARLATRFDPATATGLLLTLALIVIIVGGAVLGALGLLVRSNSSLLSIDSSVAPWGEQHMTSFSQSMLDFVTSFGSNLARSTGIFLSSSYRIASEIETDPNTRSTATARGARDPRRVSAH